MIPVVLPEEYDLTATIERKQGTGYFTLGLVAKDKKFHVLVDYQNATMTTISLFNRQWGTGLQRVLPNDKIAHNGAVLTNGKPSRVVCSVRSDRLSVTIDGKLLVDYKKPDYDAATAYRGFAVPDESTLSLIASGPFLVRGLALRPVRGLPRRK